MGASLNVDHISPCPPSLSAFGLHQVRHKSINRSIERGRVRSMGIAHCTYHHHTSNTGADSGSKARIESDGSLSSRGSCRRVPCPSTDRGHHGIKRQQHGGEDSDAAAAVDGGAAGIAATTVAEEAAATTRTAALLAAPAAPAAFAAAGAAWCPAVRCCRRRRIRPPLRKGERGQRQREEEEPNVSSPLVTAVWGGCLGLGVARGRLERQWWCGGGVGANRARGVGIVPTGTSSRTTTTGCHPCPIPDPPVATPVCWGEHGPSRGACCGGGGAILLAAAAAAAATATEGG